MPTIRARDFLNWTVIDAGTFDYAADAWGYTAGAAVEWYQGAWTLRGGPVRFVQCAEQRASGAGIS